MQMKVTIHKVHSEYNGRPFNIMEFLDVSTSESVKVASLCFREVCLDLPVSYSVFESSR